MKIFRLKNSWIPILIALFFVSLIWLVHFSKPERINEQPIISILILIGFPISLFFLIRGTLFARVKLNRDKLVIQADCSHQSNLEDLQLEQAQIIDLQLSPNLHTAFRTRGTGLLTYKTGYFTLANKTNAFLYISDNKKVVHIPAKHGKDILLSLENPEEFIKALKESMRATS